MIKRNWRFKRHVNVVFFKLRNRPRVLRLLVKLVWFCRYIGRGFTLSKQDSRGGILINERYGLLHAANPKVASSSLKNYFQQSLPNSDIFISHSIEQLSNCTNKKFEEYYSFTVVRNSWSRVYSCWRDKISNNGKFADVFIITRYQHLYPDMPFSEFVDWLCFSPEGADEHADRHWISQSTLLSLNSLSKPYDTIICIENLGQEFRLLAKKLGLPENHLSKTNTNSKVNLPELTEDVLNKIEKRYAADIKNFGFSRPL